MKTNAVCSVLLIRLLCIMIKNGNSVYTTKLVFEKKTKNNFTIKQSSENQVNNHFYAYNYLLHLRHMIHHESNFHCPCVGAYKGNCKCLLRKPEYCYRVKQSSSNAT